MIVLLPGSHLLTCCQRADRAVAVAVAVVPLVIVLMPGSHLTCCQRADRRTGAYSSFPGCCREHVASRVVENQTCMYVCMYACRIARSRKPDLYVCMYVCMYACRIARSRKPNPSAIKVSRHHTWQGIKVSYMARYQGRLYDGQQRKDVPQSFRVIL